jgi:alpha-L-fucosidase
MKKIFLIMLVLLQLKIAKTQNYQPTWKSLDTRPIPTWFEDAKFGIFIHWGIYSVPAWRKLEDRKYGSYSEWYYAKVMYNPDNGGQEFHRKNFGENFEYRDFASLFRAELFEPMDWANLFKKSGAKYVVLTSKHHDGFCLWPTTSPYKTNWNSLDVGPKRDLVGDLTAAVKSVGLRMGLYYSIVEWESSWTHRTESGYYLPGKIIEKYMIPKGEYVNFHLIPEMKELIGNYQPSLIFADGGEWDGNEEYLKTKEFLAWLYNESPVKNEVVVNDRFAKNMPMNHGDYFSSEYNDTSGKFMRPWEESRGVGGSYGFNRAENAEDYSTSKQLIWELIDIVSRGGNLLLNVGPNADGTIPVVMQERLLDIGKWLEVNGEAIYQTRKRAITSQKCDDYEVYFTIKPKALYCIFTHWSKKIVINLLENETVRNVKLIGYDGHISWTLTDKNKIIIEIPQLTIDQIPCLNAWSFKIDI